MNNLHRNLLIIFDTIMEQRCSKTTSKMKNVSTDPLEEVKIYRH